MTPDEMWHNQDWTFECPVCGFEKGEHYYAFCPLPNGLRPSIDAQCGKEITVIPGPKQPKGRYGVPITYDDSPAPTCDSVKDNVKGVINDHVCPTCKNDRCTKSEISCWKCGEKL